MKFTEPVKNRDLTQGINVANLGLQMCRKPRRRAKPSDGLEPSTPSLPWRCSTD